MFENVFVRAITDVVNAAMILNASKTCLTTSTHEIVKCVCSTYVTDYNWLPRNRGLVPRNNDPQIWNAFNYTKLQVM